jgi:hypothetical protein
LLGFIRKYIQFGVHSQEQIARTSEVELWAKEFYKFQNGTRSVVENGALDRRLVCYPCTVFRVTVQCEELRH